MGPNSGSFTRDLFRMQPSCGRSRSHIRERRDSTITNRKWPKDKPNSGLIRAAFRNLNAVPALDTGLLCRNMGLDASPFREQHNAKNQLLSEKSGGGILGHVPSVLLLDCLNGSFRYGRKIIRAG
jgi:hypothetical protein